MKHIVIVGGGFAGLWAALGAAHQVDESTEDIQITMVSRDPYLNIRPRFYEKYPDALREPLLPTLDPIDVRFYEGTVVSIDATRMKIDVLQLDSTKEEIHYDRLILATGSELKRLPIPGMAEHSWNIDTYNAAVAFDRHLDSVMQASDSQGNNTFVVIGAGLAGIELATEMRDRIVAHSNVETAEKSHIFLIERNADIGSGIGLNAWPAVEAAILNADIEVRAGTCVDTITSTTVRLSNGEMINTKTVINTAGLRASTPDEALPVERDELGRITTDSHLRARGLETIYAAGDVAHAYADDNHLALMSCQHAMEMGKFAGSNAARDLLGLPLFPYHQPVYLTCIDLGRSGALFTSGWDRKIQKSGDEAKRLKEQINTQWIYPPVGTRDQILAAVNLDTGREVSNG